MDTNTIALITSLLIAAGTIFSAIYAARGGAEKTLKEHIENLEASIKDLQTRYDSLLEMYEKERRRGDRLERRLRSLTKKKGR